jgi:hypothetical protein
LLVVVTGSLRWLAADVLPLVHHLMQQDRDDEPVVFRADEIGIERDLVFA